MLFFLPAMSFNQSLTFEFFLTFLHLFFSLYNLLFCWHVIVLYIEYNFFIWRCYMSCPSEPLSLQLKESNSRFQWKLLGTPWSLQALLSKAYVVPGAPDWRVPSLTPHRWCAEHIVKATWLKSPKLRATATLRYFLLN